MNRFLPFLLALLVTDLAVAEGTNSVDRLTETVRAVNQSLRSHDYSNAVQRLFSLTNETEITPAVALLQRPQCLAFYEHVFAQLVNIKPSLNLNSAFFNCPNPVVIGTNYWDRFDRVEVGFFYNGSRWVFHDPSFEKKLGRRMTSKGSAIGDRKPVLTRELLMQSVTMARNGDAKRLGDMEHMLNQLKEKVLIPKELLPVYTELLKDQDIQIQRLGLYGIAFFHDPQSQVVLIDYIKAMNPRELEDRYERSTKADREKNNREYSDNMINASIAVCVLGEVGDPSVIPFLESLRGIRDLKMEWMDSVVGKSQERMKARGATNNTHKVNSQ